MAWLAVIIWRILLHDASQATGDIYEDFQIVPSTCPSGNELDYFLPVTIVDCFQTCARRKQCVAINYNWPSASCFLLQSGSTLLSNGTIVVKSSSSTNGETSPCYSALVDAVPTWLVSGPCGLRPCGPLSVCTDLPGGLHRCDVAYCESSTTIPHVAFMSSVLTRVGSKNALRCMGGFYGIGNAVLWCLSNGLFSSTDFYCVKTCPSLPIKTGAKVVSSSSQRFLENTTAIFECTEGFYNLSFPIIHCQPDGHWSQFECIPACHRTEASYLPNGFVLNGTSSTVWNTISDHLQYACNDLHYLSPGEPTIHCDLAGQWSPINVHCYPNCLPETAPISEHSELVPGYDVMYTFDEELSYECVDGFYAWPETFESVCETSGSWTPPSAACFPYCPVPTPDHGIPQTTTMQFMFDDSVIYNCDGNHYFNGMSLGTATCRDDGTWQYDAVCYPYCGDPPGIGYGDIKSVSQSPPFTVGTKAVYECNVGLYASPSDTKTCTLDGGWSGHVGCCFFTHEFNGDSCVWGK